MKKLLIPFGVLAIVVAVSRLPDKRQKVAELRRVMMEH
jgi:hypothetical protein